MSVAFCFRPEAATPYRSLQERTREKERKKVRERVSERA